LNLPLVLLVLAAALAVATPAVIAPSDGGTSASAAYGTDSTLSGGGPM
jgi:hypothetical protein